MQLQLALPVLLFAVLLVDRGKADAGAPPGDPIPPMVPGAVRRVVKGGSFLCHPDYCESYRPSARRGSDPGTATSDSGSRCALDAPETAQ